MATTKVICMCGAKLEVLSVWNWVIKGALRDFYNHHRACTKREK